jgi:type II secretory pathway pseudopilin PulG
MTNLFLTRRRPRSSEEGYILIAVIFMLAIFIIALSVAVPKVAKEIQRDRELETMQRGKQYIRGIQMYYKKFNAYPPNIEALIKTNNIRFLRKKYVDPTTGKEDWKAIRFGQNKAPTAMGFFGQPLTGSTLAGIGPNGGNGVAGASNPGAGFMSANSPTSGTLPAAGTTSISSDASTTTSGTTGSTANGTNTASTSGSTDSTSTSASSSSTSGQTFGGAGIIGFSPNSPKQSILLYKKKNHYNEWEFVYDPILEQMMQSGNTGNIGQPATTAFPSTSPSTTSPSPSPSPPAASSSSNSQTPTTPQ